MVLRWLAPAALALTACGPPAADTGFDATFRQAATEACVRTATARGVEKASVDRYCTCFVGQFDGLTEREKVDLGVDRTKVDAAAVACRDKLLETP